VPEIHSNQLVEEILEFVGDDGLHRRILDTGVTVTKQVHQEASDWGMQTTQHENRDKFVHIWRSVDIWALDFVTVAKMAADGHVQRKQSFATRVETRAFVVVATGWAGQEVMKVFCFHKVERFPTFEKLIASRIASEIDFASLQGWTAALARPTHALCRSSAPS
jgi:hypothetical protein